MTRQDDTIKMSNANKREDTNIRTSEISLEEIGEDVTWEELPTTLKLLCPTYLKIKDVCSFKALQFKCLKENTAYIRT